MTKIVRKDSYAVKRPIDETDKRPTKRKCNIRNEKVSLEREDPPSATISIKPQASCSNPSPECSKAMAVMFTPSSQESTKSCTSSPSSQEDDRESHQTPSSTSSGEYPSTSKQSKNSKLLFSPSSQPSPFYSTFRSLTTLPTPEYCHSRNSPFPKFAWADAEAVWADMVRKDAIYPRDHKMLDRHPQIKPQMRAILLDWLIEVAEAYKMHRETYYLAQDFIDRYLALHSNLPKPQVQLLGISSLFLAAKMEEIYPPKLSEFSFVTDGACSEEEIHVKELVILKTLQWNINPLTVTNWLSTYTQTMMTSKSAGKAKLLVPAFTKDDFFQATKIADLAMLDIDCLKFSYSMIAASALYLQFKDQSIYEVTGFSKGDLKECIDWMRPFAKVIENNADSDPVGSSDEAYEKIIMQHHVTVKMLDEANELRSTNDWHLINEAAFLTPPEQDIYPSPPEQEICSSQSSYYNSVSSSTENSEEEEDDDES